MKCLKSDYDCKYNYSVSIKSKDINLNNKLISSAYINKDKRKQSNSAIKYFSPISKNTDELLNSLKSNVIEEYNKLYDKEIKLLEDKYKDAPCINCMEKDENLPYIIDKYELKERCDSYSNKRNKQYEKEVNKIQRINYTFPDKDDRINESDNTINVSKDQTNRLYDIHQKIGHDQNFIYDNKNDIVRFISIKKEAEKLASQKAFVFLLEKIIDNWSIIPEIKIIFDEVISNSLIISMDSKEKLISCTEIVLDIIEKGSDIEEYNRLYKFTISILDALMNQRNKDTNQIQNENIKEKKNQHNTQLGKIDFIKMIKDNKKQ